MRELPDMRRRARELWEEEPGISMPELAARLSREGFAATVDTLRKWRNREKWGSDAKPIADAANDVAKAARKAVRRLELAPPTDRGVTNDPDVEAAPTIDGTITRLMTVCNEIGKRVEKRLFGVNVAKTSDVLALATAMKTTAEAAAILQEADLRSRGLSMKDIKALGPGGPITGELLPAGPMHSHLTGAIEAFKRG